MSRRTCGRARKVILKTELDAMIVLARRQNQDKGEKRYYKCSFGSHYHLTSEDKKAVA